MQPWPRQEQTTPRWNGMDRAERSAWHGYHEEHCGGKLSQKYEICYKCYKEILEILETLATLPPPCQAWYGEVKYMDADCTPSDAKNCYVDTFGSVGIISTTMSPMIFPRSGTKTGEIEHYTQVVWAESSRLGCGKRGLYVVCNYLSGNMPGSSMYKRVNHLICIKSLLLQKIMNIIPHQPTHPGSRLLGLP